MAFAADYIPAELEYTNEEGRVIGYWAYGRWEPGRPYQGQPGYKVIQKS